MNISILEYTSHFTILLKFKQVEDLQYGLIKKHTKGILIR